MILSRKATVLYSVLIFASGGVLGALTHRLYTVSSVAATTRPSGGADEWRKKYLAEMQSRLHLSSEQNLKLNIYLDETRSRVREAHAKTQPEVEQIKREQREKIKAMLDANQKAEYEKLLEERDQRDRQQKASGHGPGGI
jgi:Spy/CpxP family protein refolding chaperone